MRFKFIYDSNKVADIIVKTIKDKFYFHSILTQFLIIQP